MKMCFRMKAASRVSGGKMGSLIIELEAIWKKIHTSSHPPDEVTGV